MELSDGQTSPAAGLSSPGPSALPLPAGQGSSPASAGSLAPYETRRANAETVKVTEEILGLRPGSSLDQAHAILDKLSDPGHPAKEEEEEPQHDQDREEKVLWQLAGTDYAFVFVKADDAKRIIYIKGFLRPGKEIPFDKIGEPEKAPVQDANTIAWDVLRPNRPLFRVVATGAERKATSVMIFKVKRPDVDKKGTY